MNNSNLFNIIVAHDKNRVIGKDGKIPWDLPEDMKRFREITKGSIIVMGRKTFESIGNRPLLDKINVVITSEDNIKVAQYNNARERIFTYKTPEGFMNNFFHNPPNEFRGRKIFVIGGESIYKFFLPYCDTLYITEVDMEVKDGDTFFPEINKDEYELKEKIYFGKCTFNTYIKIHHPPVN